MPWDRIPLEAHAISQQKLRGRPRSAGGAWGSVGFVRTRSWTFLSRATASCDYPGLYVARSGRPHLRAQPRSTLSTPFLGTSHSLQDRLGPSPRPRLHRSPMHSRVSRESGCAAVASSGLTLLHACEGLGALLNRFEPAAQLRIVLIYFRRRLIATADRAGEHGHLKPKIHTSEMRVQTPRVQDTRSATLVAQRPRYLAGLRSS
jgi:hypothetical protein